VRLVISLGGIGFAILLMLLLRGIMDGTISRSTTFVDHVGADIFVSRAGVTNMVLSSAAVPESTVSVVGATDGVVAVAAIMRFPVIVSNAGRQRPATAIGFGGEGLGGPWKLRSGRASVGLDEAVIDSDLANDLGVVLGGRIHLAGEELWVIGLSEQTAAIGGKLVFVRREQLQAIMGARGNVSFVLARLQPGRDPKAVAEAFKLANPELTALTRAELSQNDRDLLGSLFISPINVMSSAGFLVGLAIVGLTMYTTTAERLRDFGVLKAIGASNAFLFRTVMTEASVLGGAGYVIGFVAAQLSGPLVTRFVPDIGVTVTGANAAMAFLAMMAMCLVGAVAPVARIMRVDPLLVFRR
jgi:putative ABC transport system permease protein